MSRIGKKPITLPSGVTFNQVGAEVTIAGPKGTLKLPVHSDVKLEQTAEGVLVTVPKPDQKRFRSLWGLFRSLIQNMVTGVTEGFNKSLDVVGVGFKVEQKANTLVLSLGYSHPIEFALPEGITAKVEKDPAKSGLLQYQTSIHLTGIDKQLLGQTAALIRDLRKPEPYKGKGVKYSDEVIVRKAGKVVKAVGK